MARLSFDGLLLQARMNAHDEMSLIDIAIHVFNGMDPDNPGKVRVSAVNRAKVAALNLVRLKHAHAVPNIPNIVAIRSRDKTSGGMQAQAIMNLVVRGGADRRKEDRRAETDAEAENRRADEDRRAVDTSTEVVDAPVVHHTKRLARKPLKTSPFAIKNNFKLLG